ncbi:uncharacterized protein [Dendropsophus ebraccatus]|uniref:uncharacterized protein n=1 Tax=Dendropsophus ebraccatus TaxID=150705 RepID=UPI0038320753
MSIADRQKLYQDYISHYESRSHEGNVTLCDQRLECRGEAECWDSPALLAEPYSQLIRHNLQSRHEQHRVEVLRRMMKGFAILELICVNLFLLPWRKEIRTLKKFTGSFVYFVEPVIPEDIITQILQRVGYSIASDTEYTIRGKINTEEAKRTAFELYLARTNCRKLLWLMNEDRFVSVSLLVNGPSTEAHSANKHTGLGGENTCKITGVHDIDRVNNLHFQSNVTGDNDTTTKVADLTINHESSQDVITDISKKDPCYYIRHTDSDEFLEKYSDLNLAQKPIFPLHIKQNKPKEWAAPAVEPNIKPHIPETIAPEFGSVISESKDIAEVTCDMHGDNIDVRTFTDELEPPKSLILHEYPAEVIVPTKQERVVTKLKMQNVAVESLAYPVEETLPPDSTKFTNSSDLGRKEVKWAFLNTKEGTESFASPISSDFSMLNISSKSAIWTPGTENRLREPPNSTYIPPIGPKSEFMGLTDIKPEDDHFQIPSPPGGTLLVNEFKILEDTKEDYVVISRKDHLQK